jgi:murein DD-endopeptidase MepM/ murein hydrolase activator NlpD
MLNQALRQLGFTAAPSRDAPRPNLGESFGVHSMGQLASDLGEVLREGSRGRRFQFDVGSAGLLRADLSLPAYAGLVPRDRLAPIFNLFDRVGGGQRYTQRVSRLRPRDFRGGKLSYDEHDGTDFVCPIGTPLVAAAAGTVVMIRRRFLRGGLTVTVDHGHGVLTQYTHCSRELLPLGSRVLRGQPVAMSGAAGLDMLGFFPWVPPHLHFSVIVDGAPVDPFSAEGEVPGRGSWLQPDAPTPSGPLPEDPRDPQLSPVDHDALRRAGEACVDAGIRRELRDCEGAASRLSALLEDALLHDAWAWPEGFIVRSLRPAGTEDEIRLTLPLGASDYVGVRFADSRWTRPPAAMREEREHGQFAAA